MLEVEPTVEADHTADVLALLERGGIEDRQGVLGEELLELRIVLDQRSAGGVTELGGPADIDVLLECRETRVDALGGLDLVGESVQHRPQCRVVLGVFGREDQLLDRHVLRVVVAAGLPGLRDAHPPALDEEGQVLVRSAEEQDLVVQGVTAGEDREVLMHDGVGQRVHNLVRRDPGLDQVDDIGLGEHPTLCGDVVELRRVELQVAHRLLRHADLEHALVDGRPGARRALVVHRRERRLFGLSVLVLCRAEHDDLGVLPAELDDGSDVGMELLDADRDRVDLLHEPGVQGFQERAAARARRKNLDVFGTGEGVADSDHEIPHHLGLAGLVALVVAPQDLGSVGVADYGLDGRRANVDTNSQVGRWLWLNHGRWHPWVTDTSVY